MLNLRVGVSFRSVEQACANAEEEVGSASFEEVRERARALWQDKLKRLEIDIPNTHPNITQMAYSSMYRSFLTPVSLVFDFCCASHINGATEQRHRRNPGRVPGYHFAIL